MPIETRRIEANGLTLNVRITGSGSPVLLLHGFPDSAALWDAVTLHLAVAGYRVIAPDLRGFGDSGAPAGVRHYALTVIVEDLVALLDHACSGARVNVVGHDWGSVVAWQARGLAESRRSRGDFAGLRRWARQRPGIDECVRRMARPGRLTAGLNWYRANLVSVLFGSWRNCVVPMLVIWSSDDDLLAEDRMRRSARRMSAPWKYVRIDRAGRWLPLEQPHIVARPALDWFHRQEGGS